MEPLWRNGTGIERPFSATAGVNCRGRSLPLQRVMTDFGADHPFAPAAAKLKEHYGIDVPVSAVQRTTEHHAQCMYEQEAARAIAPGTSAACFIGEVDGSMVPVVESSAASADQRKGKVLRWKEVRLTLVHRHGSVSPVFGGHLAGGVEESGRQWGRCAAKAGFGPASHLHGLGDGAPWIVNPFDLHFGTQGCYLIDFFHVCDYLSAAAPRCAPDHPQAWLDVQKERLKANQVAAVLDALAPFANADREDDPVVDCDRYLRNRLDYLDYQGAVPQGLPIGSGEIESAHRYIIQQRLKRPGAWWSSVHVEAMLALRLNRANHEWEAYWQRAEKQATGTGQPVVASL